MRRGISFPTPDQETRVSDVALGLSFPTFGDYEPHRDRAKEEPVYEPKAVEAFLQFMSMQDVRYETTPYSPLPAEEGARRRLEFSKQSQVLPLHGLLQTWLPVLGSS